MEFPQVRFLTSLYCPGLRPFLNLSSFPPLYHKHNQGEMPVILCCMCGIEIQHNATNMCVACLRSSVDITEELTRSITIHSCRTCKRFHLPPWTECELESKVLMAACLKRINGLKGLKLVDAAWVWTEPHSMRLKIKITVSYHHSVPLPSTALHPPLIYGDRYKRRL